MLSHLERCTYQVAGPDVWTQEVWLWSSSCIFGNQIMSGYTLSRVGSVISVIIGAPFSHPREQQEWEAHACLKIRGEDSLQFVMMALAETCSLASWLQHTSALGFTSQTCHFSPFQGPTVPSRWERALSSAISRLPSAYTTSFQF